MNSLAHLADQALALEPPTRSDALAVLDVSDAETPALVAAAARVRRHYFGDRVKLNFLFNAKSGLCPEDCNYCSQSKLSTAPIQRYRLLGPDQAVEAASTAVSVGAKRFCMVASGRGPSERELDRFTELVRAVRREHPELEICACLGLLKDGQSERLADAGVHAYNHNLNTSSEHYADICSTHSYEDRIDTLRRATAAGLSPCSGALFGLGESNQDIVDVVFALRELRPDSVPINFLIPIDGTPLAGSNELTPWRCLRILALFRLVFPDVEVRIAGGRELHLRSLQPLGLLLANSVFAGDYLTTRGEPAESDRRMIEDMGLRIEGSAEPTLPKHRLEVELR